MAHPMARQAARTPMDCGTSPRRTIRPTPCLRRAQMARGIEERLVQAGRGELNVHIRVVACRALVELGNLRGGPQVRLLRKSDAAVGRGYTRDSVRITSANVARSSPSAVLNSAWAKLWDMIGLEYRYTPDLPYSTTISVTSGSGRGSSRPSSSSSGRSSYPTGTSCLPIAGESSACECSSI